jgi:hypothetical protein
MAKEILIMMLTLNTIVSPLEQVRTARLGAAKGISHSGDKFCVETCAGLC